MSLPTFLLPAALLALPLIGIPVLLHLLFRRKSPVIRFSTIRFIQTSIQRTAARRRVQWWTLLACRVLALLLLILVATQPAQILAFGWAGGGRSLQAAVVIDSSYSMLLKDRHVTLLARADGMAQELLRGPLKNAKVAIFTSRATTDGTREHLAPSADLLTQWSPLHPQPNPHPLSDRIVAAIELLKANPSDDKWLVVISDFQKKEFPRQVAAFPEAHIVFIDLHPPSPDSAGITHIALDPPRPTAGIGADVVVDVAGSSSRPRPLSVSVTTPDGGKLLDTPTQMAAPDAAGHARIRFPLRLPLRPWLLVGAAFSDDDDMSWDNARRRLLQMPPRQIVTVVSNPRQTAATRFVSLALDPLGGSSEAWPLLSRTVARIARDANVGVLILDAWPDTPTTDALQLFVHGGGTLIWFIRPGLERSWPRLPPDQRAKLADLLPAEPLPAERSDQTPYSLGASSLQDPLLSGLTDKRFGLDAIFVLRLVPFATTNGSATTILTAFPADPRPGTHPQGFLYRRQVGGGLVYTFATLPDLQYTNLPTHPLFLPLMVRMALPAPDKFDAANIELGEPIVLTGKLITDLHELRITDPQGDESAVNVSTLKDGTPAFVFPNTDIPGVYRWHKAGSDEIVSLANVQLPASESELSYARSEDVMPAADNIVTAHSVQELQTHVAAINEPEPRWGPLVATLLILLCVEAFMASTAKLWKTPVARVASS